MIGERSGWRDLPLKHVADLNPEVLPESTAPDYQIAYVDIGSVSLEKGIESVEEMAFSAAPSRARRRVRHGDTIVSTVRTYLRAIAPIVDPPENLVVSTGFAVVRPRRGLDSRFLSYALRSSRFVEAVVAESTGVSYPAIAPTKLGSLSVSIGPLPEQRAIADYLDQEIAKIDALIFKQETLVERIEEKRRAVLLRAVTMGVNPDAPVRPSGFDWIGDIPQHWLVRPLKRQASRIVVGIAEAATHAYAEDGIPIIRAKNVQPNRIETDDLLFLKPEFATERASKMIRSGDLLTQRTGEYAGTTAVVPDKLHGSQCFTMIITSLHHHHVPEYFSLFLNSIAGNTFFRLESWGTAQPNISVPILADAPVCVPPPEEQRDIVNAVLKEERTFDLLRSKALRHRDLLIEHRSALITAAVTGQTDHRTSVSPKIGAAANDDRQAYRAAVSAEIISRHGAAKVFGRVKLQKLLYLAEVHSAVHELAGNYTREAAGPLARDLLSDAERGMAAAGYYNTVPPVIAGDGYAYTRIGAAGAHHSRLTDLLGPRTAALTKLIDALLNYDTRTVEAITTLYAVWNDALLDGETPSDDRIIRGVLQEWHPEKPDKFTTADLKTWLAWMKRKGLVPTGTGSRTQIDRLFV